MPHDNDMETEVIIIGKKKCPPRRHHCTSMEEGVKWVNDPKNKCPPPCQNNGTMVIGWEGNYEAIIFCK